MNRGKKEIGKELESIRHDSEKAGSWEEEVVETVGEQKNG